MAENILLGGASIVLLMMEIEKMGCMCVYTTQKIKWRGCNRIGGWRYQRVVLLARTKVNGWERRMDGSKNSFVHTYTCMPPVLFRTCVYILNKYIPDMYNKKIADF